MSWLCETCGAYVGCHQNTKVALGTMANKELRDLRIKAHNKIDVYWKNKKLSRSKIYEKLEEFFGREIHIGESDEETCKKIINEFTLTPHKEP